MSPSPPVPPADGRLHGRARVRVTGLVQGVGFRPYVLRLARSHRLGGHVRNDEAGVAIEVEGNPDAVRRFCDRLRIEAPPLADIHSVDVRAIAPLGTTRFQILPSTGGDRQSALVTPDSATCLSCLEELFDPRDRRYRYPFINCTDCGPRFSIVIGTPYDRPLTTMRSFRMCEPCREEYEDSADRRFHAQPNACAACGPTVQLLAGDGRPIDPVPALDPVGQLARLLLEGAIAAIKGIGGYHLTCVARNEKAVRALRERKHREDRAFAIMAPDLEAAGRLVQPGGHEIDLLQSPARPIVVAPRTAGAEVASAVAPGLPDLGVMLPYSPLHHLLLADVGEPLVMTSGNVSDEPICHRDEDALERLAAIADVFMTHDRPIHTRVDDSVARVVSVAGAPHPLLLRRSRGYAPAPAPRPPSKTRGAPVDRPILAVGGHLKNTFALARDDKVWIGPHIGDLENLDTLGSLESSIAHMERLFSVRPDGVAHDLHPDYLSTDYALRRAAHDGLEPVGVQHHHAHFAACLAEHGHDGPAVGVIYDGSGFGADGTVWGGELFVGDSAEVERVGFLRPVRLPGAEAAVREPWRMACSWMSASSSGPSDAPPWLADMVPADGWAQVSRLVESGIASPLTSSMGRLFDAVSALCGLRLAVTYEGQAAVELEASARLALASETSGEETPRMLSLPSTRDADGRVVLDPREMIRGVVEAVEAGAATSGIALDFHRAVAVGTIDACAEIAEEYGVRDVVLSGGVFQNPLMVQLTTAGLATAGLQPLLPGGVPPNDGGLALGQIAVVAARLRRDGAAA